MKKLLLSFSVLILFFSCTKEEDSVYTKNELIYNLYQASDFDYKGKVNFRELVSGELELTITLEGTKEESDYYFPAHLHFGSYDAPDSPIAYLLNPIDISKLNSISVLGTLSDGRKLKFDDLRNFDGHIKIHLADSGPEYMVILSAGNIGGNDNSPEAFISNKVSLCLPYFGNE